MRESTNIERNYEYREKFLTLREISKMERNFKDGEKFQRWKEISKMERNFKNGEKFERWTRQIMNIEAVHPRWGSSISNIQFVKYSYVEFVIEVHMYSSL